MYMSGLTCGCDECSQGLQGLHGMGIWETLIPMAASAIMGKDGDSGGGGGGMMPGASGGGSAPPPQPSNSISTNVQTQISPQISPNFVQQMQPQNSAVNTSASQQASANMTAGPQPRNIPQTGAMPGFDNASGYLPTGTPYYPSSFGQSQSGINPTYLAVGGVALLALTFMLTNRRRSA